MDASDIEQGFTQYAIDGLISPNCEKIWSMAYDGSKQPVEMVNFGKGSNLGYLMVPVLPGFR